VLLTSNNTRELTEALKRRCLYLWLDYPSLEHELEIVRLHTPELDEHVARKLVEVITMVRDLDLKKPPSIAESIDWARTLLLLGASDIDKDVFAQTMSVIVKHRTGHRPRRRARRRQARRPGRQLGGRPVASDSFAARILELGEELRAEGMKVGTTGLLDAFDALEHVDWTDHDIFKEALATTLAKSPDDRRVFDLVFDRFFFRAAEAAAVQEGVREQDASPAGGGDLSGDQALDALRQQIAAAMRDGNESAMRDLARLAIAAFGRQGEGSGVIGVDVQRIRRAMGLRAEPQPDLPPDDPRRDGLPRDELRRFEAMLRRELERGQIERTETLPAKRPLNELDRALPTGPLQDLAAVHRVVAQLKRRLKTQGQEHRGQRRRATSTCAGRCARRWRPAACRSSSRPGRCARAARRSSCSATSRPR
jgi:MoxR-like ATPase